MPRDSTKILIVDDLGSARKILRRLLHSLNYEDVVEAQNGEEALAKIDSQPFDLIISDWEMPKLNGIELLRGLRSNERHNKLPFIMITSINSKEAVVTAAGLKVSDFIAKPFNVTILADKITKALSSTNRNILSDTQD